MKITLFLLLLPVFSFGQMIEDKYQSILIRNPYSTPVPFWIPSKEETTTALIAVDNYLKSNIYSKAELDSLSKRDDYTFAIDYIPQIIGLLKNKQYCVQIMGQYYKKKKYIYFSFRGLDEFFSNEKKIVIAPKKAYL
ncbi:MAG: hypothetical protein ABL940_01345 [Bacteroidia bacterium]